MAPAPPPAQQVRAELEPVAFALDVPVGFQVAQHGSERVPASLMQVREVGEPCAGFPPADAAQDVSRHLVLSLVERNPETIRVMIQMGSTAGSGEPIFETPIDCLK